MTPLNLSMPGQSEIYRRAACIIVSEVLRGKIVEGLNSQSRSQEQDTSQALLAHLQYGCSTFRSEYQSEHRPL